MGYIKGFLRHLFQLNVSKLALVDEKSYVDKRANVCRFTKLLCSDIGAFSYLNPGSWLVHTKIGKFCSIGHDCYIGLPSHTINTISTSPLFTEKYNGTGYSWVENDKTSPYKQTIIGSDVWIGERVMILGGITVGDGAVIGAGSIVTKDVPPYAIVAGVPAKIIRFRFNDDVIDALQKVKWWDFPEEFLKKHIALFQNENLNLIDIQNLKL